MHREGGREAVLLRTGASAGESFLCNRIRAAKAALQQAALFFTRRTWCASVVVGLQQAALYIAAGAAPQLAAMLWNAMGMTNGSSHAWLSVWLLRFQQNGKGKYTF